MPLKMLIHLRRETLLIEEMFGAHLNLREGLKTLIVIESPVTAIRRPASFWLNLVPPQDGQRVCGICSLSFWPPRGLGIRGPRGSLRGSA